MPASTEILNLRGLWPQFTAMQSEQILQRSKDANSSADAVPERFSNCFPPAMPALHGDGIATSRGLKSRTSRRCFCGNVPLGHAML